MNHEQAASHRTRTTPRAAALVILAAALAACGSTPTPQVTPPTENHATTPVNTTPAPTPAPATGVTYAAPLTITKGGTYTGNWESTNPSIPAVTIKTSEPVTITGSNIRFTGIGVQGFKSRVTVTNTRFTGVNPNVHGKSVWRAINLEDVVNATITNNALENTGGIYFRNFIGNTAEGDTIKVLRNTSKNLNGRHSDGKGGYLNSSNIVQFVQFNSVRRIASAEIAWNEVINEPDQSVVEDNINMYVSSGTQDSPIRIHHNYIQGAYPVNPATNAQYAGGGILLGDGVSSHPDDAGRTHVYENRIVSTTNYGLSVVGGVDNHVYNNRVIASGRLPDGRALPAANVGVVLWDYAKVASRTPIIFGRNSLRDNQIGWTRVNANGSTWNNTSFTPDCTTNGNTCANNTNLGPITTSIEQAEYTKWQDDLTADGVQIGPR